MTLYQELKAAGCELDNHESDLYVEDTTQARKIVAKCERLVYSFFTDDNGKRWIDIPFMYDPWWEERRRREIMPLFQ